MRKDARSRKIPFVIPSLKTFFYRSLFGVSDFCVGLALRRRPFLEIQSGPFKGMRWGGIGIGSSLTPKLLGTYELELHGKIEELPIFDLVIDVGAAEGWYAVGLLHRHLARKVIAFEMTEAGQKNLRANAQRNSLPSDRIEIKGECTVEALRSMLASLPSSANFRLLIISDCEGFEGKLFCTEILRLCPAAHFIIETHDHFEPGVHERLVGSLVSSHKVDEIRPVRRKRTDLPQSVPCLFKLPVFYRLLLSERRCPDIAWLCAVPKTAG